MSNKFKNRLVGAIVLVAIMVILLPTLLDGDKKHYVEQFASIPLVPKVDDEVNIDSLSSIEQELTDKPILTENHVNEPTQIQPPVGLAYVVQLGALKNADRINEIIALLRLSNYRVYTIPEKPIQGTITRLFVGPYPSKAATELLLPELKKLTDLDGQVRLYSTVKDKN